MYYQIHISNENIIAYIKQNCAVLHEKENINHTRINPQRIIVYSDR